MKKRVVYIGNTNIASQIDDLKDGLTSLGHEVISGVHRTNKITSDSVDFVFSEIDQRNFSWIPSDRLRHFISKKFPAKKRIFKQIIKKCDTFIFMYTTFEKDHSDLKTLHELGKDIMILFVGDDVRWGNAQNQRNISIDEDHLTYYDDKLNSEKDLIRKLRYLRLSEKYATSIFAKNFSMALAKRSFYPLDLLINPELYTYNPAQRKVPKIIHAASNPEFKGSQIIQDVLLSLKKKGKEFEYECFDRLPYQEVLKKYADADIVIGQLYGQSLAKQGLEVLSSGTIFMTHLSRDNSSSDTYFNSNPAINISKDNLASKLVELIDDQKKRNEIALKGRPFIESNHNAKNRVQQMLQTLDEPRLSQLQIHPQFYTNSFKREKNFEHIYNKFDNLTD